MKTKIQEFSKEAEIPKLETSLTVVGRLKNINIESTTEFEWCKHAYKGDISLLVYDEETETNNVHKVGIFLPRFEKVYKNSPYDKFGAIFKAYENGEFKAIDDGVAKEEATLMRIIGDVTFEEYPKEDSVVRFNSFDGKFFNITDRTDNPKDMCQAHIEFVCTEVVKELEGEDEEETGNMIMKGYSFNPFATAGKKVVPLFDMIIEEGSTLQDALPKVYFDGITGRLTVKFLNGVEREVIEDSGNDFGEDGADEVITTFNSKNIIIGAKKPYAEGAELTEAQIKDMLKLRKMESELNQTRKSSTDNSDNDFVDENNDFGDDQDEIKSEETPDF